MKGGAGGIRTQTQAAGMGALPSAPGGQEGRKRQSPEAHLGMDTAALGPAPGTYVLDQLLPAGGLEQGHRKGHVQSPASCLHSGGAH